MSKMHPEKAKKIIATYRENNYNATKTLKQVGYSDTYSEKLAKKPIDSAYKAIAREIIASDNPQRSAMLFTGLNPATIRDEYVKIILQDKDLTNKLKALLPLLKENGVVFDDNQTTTKPVVNLTMIQNKAYNKDNEEMGGGLDSGSSVVSSIEPLAKNDQKDTFTEETEEEVIDNSIEESSNGGESDFGGISTKVSHITGIESSDGRISGLIDVLTDNNG